MVLTKVLQNVLNSFFGWGAHYHFSGYNFLSHFVLVNAPLY